MSARKEVLEAHRALFDSSGGLSYFRNRSIREETLRQSYIGYEAGAFTYPCIAKGGGLLGVHCKSLKRDNNGKRQQWWKGYADDLPTKGHGKNPDAPAKIIPFGLDTLTDLEPGSLVVLTCGEEDALSGRQAGVRRASRRSRNPVPVFWSQSTPGILRALRLWSSTMPERSRRPARMPRSCWRPGPRRCWWSNGLKPLPTGQTSMAG